MKQKMALKKYDFILICVLMKCCGSLKDNTKVADCQSYELKIIDCIKFLQDPLNSGDDVSEGDNADLFETENVVVCQYDKVRNFFLLNYSFKNILIMLTT